jgi:hypothetical protein
MNKGPSPRIRPGLTLHIRRIRATWVSCLLDSRELWPPVVRRESHPRPFRLSPTRQSNGSEQLVLQPNCSGGAGSYWSGGFGQVWA